MGTDQSRSAGNIIFGQTRGKILGLLYTKSDGSFYLRQIARHASTGVGAVQRELESLVQAGLVSRAAIGNQVFFKANNASPLFHEMRGLVAKTVGITGVLRDALASLAKKIRIALVYGSVARQEETSESDVDLLVIGTVGLEELIKVLRAAGSILGRELNPTSYSPREFKDKISQGNHFLSSVLKEKKLFVIGSEDELRNFGSKRVA